MPPLFTPPCTLDNTCLTLTEALAQDPYSLKWWGLVMVLVTMTIILLLAFSLAAIIISDEWNSFCKRRRYGEIIHDSPALVWLGFMFIAASNNFFL